MKAVFLSCLGLFALIAHLLIQRTKEIGIRKTNGASIPEVILLLSADYLKSVVISFVIACPVAWYTMYNWLQNFAYKTELTWWIFCSSGIIALAITMITVSLQTWKAATRNPIDSLRYE